jgi:hypothetical protein
MRYNISTLIQLGGQIRIEIDVASLVKSQQQMETDISNVSQSQKRIEVAVGKILSSQVRICQLDFTEAADISRCRMHETQEVSD